MKRKLSLLILAFVISGGVFAKENAERVHKHQPFDILLGLNLGLGITPNIGDLTKTDGKLPSGNYAITGDLGLTYDFYLNSWLSFSSGFLIHPDMYLILDQPLYNKTFRDVAATPVCLTIPLSAHINIPRVEWLYAGVGLNLNIPISSLLDDVVDPGVDTKGNVFVGIPIDFGFDMIKPGRGGSRFFFRITPEIHEGGVAVPVGFMWQIYNWKIFSRRR